ncbi:MAG: CDP-diacylglycerol--serine O-phosphatidyltransferase [Gammaproteobacteria bacterium]
MPETRKHRFLRLLKPHKGKLGLKVLPNIITVIGMLCGFFSMVASLTTGSFYLAAMLILIAAVLDTLDGKIARLAAAESEIGRQYDSLADMVSFGVAPAVLVYSWMTTIAVAPALMASAVYLVCVGLRLARFNIGGQEQMGPFYRGLPSPMSALCLSSLIVLFSGALTGVLAPLATLLNPAALVIVCAFTLAVSLLTVSNIKYYKFQEIRSPNTHVEHIVSVLVIAAVFGLLFYDLPVATFALSSIYVIGGLIRPLASKWRRKQQQQSKTESAEYPQKQNA